MVVVVVEGNFLYRFLMVHALFVEAMERLEFELFLSRGLNVLMGRKERESV